MTIDIDAEASAGRISAEAFRNLELAEVNGQASAMYWLRHGSGTWNAWSSPKGDRYPDADGLCRIETKADLHAFCAETLPDAYACFLRDRNELSAVSQLHIATAIVAIMTGLLVLLQVKGTRRHRRFGTVYVARWSRSTCRRSSSSAHRRIQPVSSPRS
jgi:hypothetical protein